MAFLLIASVAATPVPATPLSSEGKALLCASAAEGDPALPRRIGRLLAGQQPAAAAEIETLTAAIEAAGTCPAPPPPPPAPAAPASMLKGQLEFGLGQSTGPTDMANANIAAALQGDIGKWRQSLRLTLDYQDIEGIAANERYTANWDVRRTLSKTAFVSALTSFERDPQAGFATRLTQSIGFGAKLPLAPTFMLDLSGGPSRRETEWLGARGTETQIGARGSAALAWKLSDRIDVAASTSGIFEAASGTIEGQASITGKLIGPLATRLQFVARHETRALPGIDPTSTTSRASIVYDF